MNELADTLLLHLANARNRSLTPVGPGHLTDAELLEYVEGSLDDTSVREVREHLNTCYDCMESVLLLRAYRAEQQLASAIAPDQAPRDVPRRQRMKSGFRNHVIRWGEAVMAVVNRLRDHAIRPGWAAAAAIVVIVGAVLLALEPVGRPIEVANVDPQPRHETSAQPAANPVPEPEAAAPEPAVEPQTEMVPEIPDSPAGTAPAVSKVPAKPVPAPPLNPRNLVAVVVANADYSAVRLPPEPAALHDAEEIRRWLAAFGVPGERTLYLENASSARLNEVFGSRDQTSGILSQTVTAETDVLVYYAGYAVPDLNSHRPYLLPVDADPNYAALSGYALDTLLRNVGQLNARSVTIVLETSFAGTTGSKALFRGISPGLVNVRLPTTVPDKVTVLGGADRGQVNSVQAAQRGHLFTQALLRALGGAADRDGDRLISMSEAVEFVQQEVTASARRSGAEQTPWVRGATTRGLVSVY